MPQNFYKQDGSYFTADTNTKIADLGQLNSLAKLGGKEVAYSAPAIPTGATKIAGPSGLQGLNESQIYRSGADIYKLPTAVPSSVITGTTPKIDQIRQDTGTLTSFRDALEPGIKGFDAVIANQLAPAPEQSLIDQRKNKIDTLNEQQYQKPNDLTSTRNQYGFDANVNDWQKLQVQISSKKAQFDSLNNQVGDSSGLTRITGGTQDKLARQSAVELGGLASMSQALQGNIEMANSIATQTVNEKYAPIENDIANQKYQIEQLGNQLSATEKKRAEALVVTLNERTRLIEEKKQTETNISNIMTEAAKNKADSTILQRIMNAKDVKSAVLIAKDYLVPASSEDNAPKKIGTDANGNDLFWDGKSVKTAAQISSNLGQPVGEIQGLPSYDTRATNPGVNRSNRNNNPGNIKVSSYTKTFNGVAGVESSAAADGGNFLIFDSPESGINAIGQLLLTAKSYKGVTAEQAIKKYNGGGAYGALTLGLNPNQDFQSQIQDPIKLQAIAQAIAKAEGFIGNSTPSNTNAKSLADAIIAGNAKLTDIPQADRAAVIAEIQKSGKNVAELEQKQKTAESTKSEAVSIIDTLLGSKSIGNATGFSSWTTKIKGTNAYSFGRSFDQLRDLLAMGNIDKLKGAMSDKDIEFLRNSATKLALGLPKDEFIAELNKLKTRLVNPTSSINTSTSGTTASGIGYTIE